MIEKYNLKVFEKCGHVLMKVVYVCKIEGLVLSSISSQRKNMTKAKTVSY